jgi:hypothetical protein
MRDETELRVYRKRTRNVTPGTEGYELIGQ